MSKILAASCENGVVTVDGQGVDAEILSEGVAASEGIVVLEGESVTYIGKTSPDLKTLITDLDGLLTQLVTVLNILNAGLTSPGTATTGITALTNLQTQLALTKDNLR